MVNPLLKNKTLGQSPNGLAVLLFVLFGLRPNLAAPLERSPLDHSVDYAPAGDRPSGFARLTLTSEPFAQYAG